jgi:4-amino-4-deoxy-L-arabinose transferase-like glycosyltransferase
LVFFSVFLNKLPGYLLPVLPAVAALLGIAIAQAEARAKTLVWLLAACAALLWVIPAIQDLLPVALFSGVSRVHFEFPIRWILPSLLVALACALLDRKGWRDTAFGLIALLTTVSVAMVIWQVYPVLDRTVSARAYSKSHAQSITCVDESNRAWLYGLNYYAGRDLPDCK